MTSSLRYPHPFTNEEEFGHIFLGHDWPQIAPHPSLKKTLLQSALNLPAKSIAEEVITEIHDKATDMDFGAPLGTIQVMKFGLLWTHRARPAREPVFIEIDDGEASSMARLALFKDGSAVLFVAPDFSELIPVPQPFSLALPDSWQPSDLEGLSARDVQGDVVDLARFLGAISPPTRIYSNPACAPRFPLQEALQQEVDAWIDWLSTARPALGTTAETDVEDEAVIYPWRSYCQPLHIDHMNRLTPTLQGLLHLILSQEKIHPECLVDATIMGRTFHRDGRLSPVGLELRFTEDIDDSRKSEIERRWCDFTARLFDHPDIDVPPKAQISFNQLGPAMLASLEALDINLDASAHEKITAMVRVQNMGGPLPQIPA